MLSRLRVASRENPFMARHHVIAIDGPAASGKSTVARRIAEQLGFLYVNSGAMYRAVTWYALQRGIDSHQPAAVARVIKQASIVCRVMGNETYITINDIDPCAHLRDDEVNRAVPLVSRVGAVRELLNRKMRECGRDHNVVVEGRDIGSVVFPQTPFKFYIDASVEVRARRRAAQGEKDEIVARDRFDSLRENAPLMVAPDAEIIDSSKLTIVEVVDAILQHLAGKGLPMSLHRSRVAR
jgi:cytidylate kinase